MEFVQTLLEPIAVTLGNLVWALIILIGGWIVALIIRAGVRGLLNRITLDNRIVQAVAGEEAAEKIEVERWTAQIVYYLVMLFVLIAFFNQLNLTAVAGPLQSLLDIVFGYIPQLIAAGALILVAWLVATGVRFAIRRLFDATHLDERLTNQTGAEVPGQVSVSHTLAEAIYWFIYLLFLPAILSALGMQGLLGPVQDLVNQLLSYVPNLLAAAAILFVGWIIARIIRQIVTNLLMAAGFDRLGERAGLEATLGAQTLSNLIGLIVYILIMLMVLIAAFNALAIEAITGPAVAMLTMILGAVPGIVSAIIVIAIAYFIGRMVADLVKNLLTGLGFNRILVWLNLGREPAEGERTPADIVGYLVLIVVMFFAVAAAAELVGFVSLTSYMELLILFLSRLVVAVIVFGLGLYLANLARNVIRSTGGAQANFLAQVAWLAVVFFAGALALGQTGISQEIVNMAFGLSLGAVAVAAAIAFGLGGRDIAARELEDVVASMKSEDS
jgi:hypothetical protein